MAQLMTVEELAEYLRITKRTIYRLLKKGNIPAVKVGHKWRFDKETIDNWLHPKMESEKVRILVIDDAPVIGLLFKEALEGSGDTIITASASTEGLEYVEQLDFDLIFLDLKMHQMDGEELFARIKKIKPQIPVTIITGYPDSEIMVRALQEGPFNVMKKPFDTLSVVTAVNQAKVSKSNVSMDRVERISSVSKTPT